VSITSVCRFVSHAGAEVSVRTSRDLNTDRLMIEPLYATDIELLDGASGALHSAGEVLHGTLQRQGGVFMLTPEGASVPRTYRRTRVVHAPSVPVVVRRPAPARARPRKRDGAPAGIEVGEAIETLARFVRGDRDVPLTAARRAHAAIGQFLGLPQRRS
jgi:hypothetical protein